MLFSFCFTFNLLIIKKKKKNVPKTQWQFSATIHIYSGGTNLEMCVKNKTQQKANI